MRRERRGGRSTSSTPNGTAVQDGVVPPPGAAEPAKASKSKDSDSSDEVRVLTADFPSLVDLVVGTDGNTEFLFVWPDGTRLESCPRYAPNRKQGSKSVVYVPPPSLPWLLPRAVEVRRWLNEDDTAYFAALQEWIRQHVDLADDRYVPLLAAWIAHTYIVDLCPNSPLVVLLGPPETGKTRVLAACIHTARRGVLTMNAREAALIRYTDEYKASIGLDLVDFMGAIRSTLDFFAARTQNDGTVTTRVIDHQKGRFQSMQHYEAYGATLIASNTPISDDVIGSRSLVLQARQSGRRFPEHATPEAARELRERGTAFRARVLLRRWRRRLPQFADLAPGRLGDLLKGLAWVVQMCDPTSVAVLRDLVTVFTEARQAEAADTVEVEALRECIRVVDTGATEVKLTELTKALNAIHVEDHSLHGRRLSGILRASLDLKVLARTGNQRYVQLDRKKLAALATRYNLELPAGDQLPSTPAGGPPRIMRKRPKS